MENDASSIERGKAAAVVLLVQTAAQGLTRYRDISPGFAEQLDQVLQGLGSLRDEAEPGSDTISAHRNAAIVDSFLTDLRAMLRRVENLGGKIAATRKP